MVLNLLNLYSFIFATFSVIHGKSNKLTQLKGDLIKKIPQIKEPKLRETKRAPQPSSPKGMKEFMAAAALIMANLTGQTSMMQAESTTEMNISKTFVYENFTTYPSVPLSHQYESTAEYESTEYSVHATSLNPVLEENSSLTTLQDGEAYSLFETEGGEYVTTDNMVFNSSPTDLVGTGGSGSFTTTLYGETTEQTTSNYIAGNYNISSIQTSTNTTPDYNYTVPWETTESSCKDGCLDVATNKTRPDEGNTTENKSISIDGCTTQQDSPRGDLSLYTNYLSKKNRKELHNLCWETMFGQELVKLTVMDLVLYMFMTVLSILMGDFVRALFVRLLNSCWCWDLEKTFPQYADFKMAENLLHLVNNQGMVWMGMFFSPGLPLINVLKLIVMMYMRSWAVLTCNIPHDVVFRASRSNNFYFGLLLTMLFLCVLPVGYALVWIEPSWHCGPFSNYNKIYHLFTSSIKKLIPGKGFHRVLDYIASPSVVIPLLVLLILIIFYLLSLTYALREANDDLKIQLRRERTEERRKMYQIANKKRRGTEVFDSPFNKWCKIICTNSVRKISLDNTANTINGEKTQFNSVNHNLENRKGGIVRDVKGDSSTTEISREETNTKRNRKDAVVHKTSAENVPEIKICQTKSTKDDGGTLDKSSRSKTRSRDTIQKTTGSGNIEVFSEK